MSNSSDTAYTLGYLAMAVVIIVVIIITAVVDKIKRNKKLILAKLFTKLKICAIMKLYSGIPVYP